MMTLWEGMLMVQDGDRVGWFLMERSQGGFMVAVSDGMYLPWPARWKILRRWS